MVVVVVVVVAAVVFAFVFIAVVAGVASTSAGVPQDGSRGPKMEPRWPQGSLQHSNQ